MSKKFLSPIRLAQGATNPAVGSEGELFWNTTDLKVYIHNGTSWAASGGAFTMSPTAPTSPEPKHGDPWFDTSDGSLYVRYVDVDNTGQWVQVQTNSAINSELANRAQALETDVSVLQAQTSGFEADVISLDSRTDSLESRTAALEQSYRSPNYIINGGMDIWQRGTSATQGAGTGSSYISADRWKVGSFGAAPAISLDRSSDVPVGIGVSYSAKMSWGSSTSTGDVFVTQVIEDGKYKFAGKTVTVSFYAKAAAPITVGAAFDQDYAGTNISLTSSWARYSFTTVLPTTYQTSYPAGSAGWNHTELRLFRMANVSAASNSVYFTGVQVEEGLTPSKFRPNAPSIQAELAACQRYYYRWTADNTYAWVGIATGNGSNAWMPIPFPVTMRAVPSTTPEWSGSFSAMNFLLGGTPTSFVYAGDGMNKSCATLTFSGSGFASATIVRSNNTTGLYFGFSAEL